ncbi:hypothetical protein FCH28_21865 [Streptomyces piniterrae]|uniref:Uncharacterized protein n=1 Tax=Streptomyces piniterrae TaxID=2571125 RepID=A0A4U0NCA0_9ACTN|nr:hypothetical protein [Streptomyces piniterrae]TJZ51142.1 hypothetical protein FCH28_21865 [Streptomyces piniterrae]
MWFASGLLAPVVAVFPVQTPASLPGGGSHGGGAVTGGDGGFGGSPDELLDPWVWGVVYTGFIVQALALGALFVRYARERRGHLRRGRVGTLPDSPTGAARRQSAAAVVVLAVLPAVTHLLWAAGGTAGPNPARSATQDLNSRLNDTGYVLFAALAAAGALMLGYGRGRRVPLLLPLAAAWTGSAALACWGGWMMLTGITADAGGPMPPSPLLSVTYAVQMIVGMLVAVAGAHFFAEREAARCG